MYFCGTNFMSYYRHHKNAASCIFCSNIELSITRFLAWTMTYQFQQNDKKFAPEKYILYNHWPVHVVMSMGWSVALFMVQYISEGSVIEVAWVCLQKKARFGDSKKMWLWNDWQVGDKAQTCCWVMGHYVINEAGITLIKCCKETEMPCTRWDGLGDWEAWKGGTMWRFAEQKDG